MRNPSSSNKTRRGASYTNSNQHKHQSKFYKNKSFAAAGSRFDKRQAGGKPHQSRRVPFSLGNRFDMGRGVKQGNYRLIPNYKPSTQHYSFYKKKANQSYYNSPRTSTFKPYRHNYRWKSRNFRFSQTSQNWRRRGYQKRFNRRRVGGRGRFFKRGWQPRKRFTGPYAKFLRRRYRASTSRGTTFNKKWFHCKKPYWRRKSYKFVKLFNLIYLNTFKAYMLRRRRLLTIRNKITNKGALRRLKKRYKGKRAWSDYFRRNKMKFWFRNKIALRLVWMSRYSCWTHRKTFKFVWRARRRTPTLLKFWRKHEFTLDRYIIWWQMAPKLTKNNLPYARWLIKNGFVYVNFVPVVMPTYEIKLGDCIFLLKMLRRKQYRKSYLVTKLIGQYKSKFRRTYRFRLFRQFRDWRSFKPKFRTFLTKYLSMNFLRHHSSSYFLYCHGFVEKSYKYKIFVNLYPLDWFTLFFSTIGKLYYPVNFYLANSFVNRRYK